MPGPLGERVVVPTPQRVDPATVFTHVNGKVWRDGNNKMQTFEDGPPRPKAPPPQLDLDLSDDDQYTGYGMVAP